ncbi:LysR substrate-binding domain-containing protein [Uliginosibacterium sp. H1]|uniref:LysR substrate-binding domain-containing protein n=1 Tax=Uliginosibacterium sp. H1 TaxID=3114757 RepID=UPI002E17AAF9|nr:LysR substrate-binding domain-containing protein [Uliginosibacterium sp. H1]
MEIRQLKYFIVVAEEGNISRAAARLHISQPPLTRHIQSLEEDLGVKLFHRTTSGVELTQAGALLLEHARDIKAHVELASLQARRMAAGQVGRIEVGVYGTAMLDIVPRILQAFSATHPDVELAMQSAPKGPQLEALRQGRLLILFDRNIVETDDIAVELIAREPIMLALHKDHPLAAEKEIRIPQLDGVPMVGELGRVHQRSSHMFQRHGTAHNVVHYAGDLISASILAASGFGIAFAPASMARMQLPDLVYRPIAGEPDAHMQLHVGYRRNDTNPLLGEMLQTARSFRDEGTADAGRA